MRVRILAALALAILAAACGPLSATDEGGANVNDRTDGGRDGDKLLSGAMVVSPDGAYAVMQRSTVSVLVDLRRETATELPFQGERFVFSKTRHILYAVKHNLEGVVAIDLDAGSREVWAHTLAFQTNGGARLFRVSDDDRALVVGDLDRVFVLDPSGGAIRGVVKVGSLPTDVAFLKNDKALVVGGTIWIDHKPSTAIVHTDLTSLASTSISIPNCEAPIRVLPDQTRALLSPTYCEEARPGGASQGAGGWTSPDPVSVIDLGPNGPRFVKNLPGFGPVALSKDGTRAVAYLDTKRMDPSMFDDKAQVPPTKGDQFHLMVIDPATLKFSLSPIGKALPRFAMTLDGRGLLVDATVQAVRGGAYATVSIGPDGFVAEAGIFGGEKAPFGYFDLDTKVFTALQGPTASLDRFVQTADGTRVFTLKTSADGMGGDLFAIDLTAKATVDLQKSLRDVGLMPDGKTLLLRLRLPSAWIDGQRFAEEDYCLSTDGGVSCGVTIRYRSSTPQGD